MDIESYDDIPLVARRIVDNIWRQNKPIFDSMDRKEMIDQIFDFMIEELMEISSETTLNSKGVRATS